MSNFNLEGLIKIVAVGVPALLILLGAFAFFGGIPIEMLSGNGELKNAGLILLILGIILYIVELIVYIWKESI